MAVQRALESARPVSTRLFVDDLSPAFLPLPWRTVVRCARVTPVRRRVERLYDRVGGPGPRPSAIARTRLIDDLIAQASPAQLVILGAGYDTRAHRLECLRHGAVYEVDHATTQANKRAVIARCSKLSGVKLTYVPVDFERDDLATKLQGAGFSPGGNTVFLWEGVTQYLTADAVDRTLTSIAQLGGPTDTFVFTYVEEAALRGDIEAFPEARRWLEGTRRRGEPWVFGLSPATLNGFLVRRGFELLEDISTLEAGERYFSPLGRPERGSGLYHVAVATFRAPKELPT